MLWDESGETFDTHDELCTVLWNLWMCGRTKMRFAFIITRDVTQTYVKFHDDGWKKLYRDPTSWYQVKAAVINAFIWWIQSLWDPWRPLSHSEMKMKGQRLDFSLGKESLFAYTIAQIKASSMEYVKPFYTWIFWIKNGQDWPSLFLFTNLDNEVTTCVTHHGYVTCSFSGVVVASVTNS